MSALPGVAEQLACSGDDWLRVDTQHGPAADVISAAAPGFRPGGRHFSRATS